MIQSDILFVQIYHLHKPHKLELLNFSKINPILAIDVVNTKQYYLESCGEPVMI